MGARGGKPAQMRRPVKASALVLLGPVAAVLAAAGCGSSAGGTPTKAATLIDEQRGTYRGVGLDDRAARVKQAIGKPAPFHGDLSPVGHDYYADGAPVALQKPRSRHDGALRYPTASFHVADGRVYGVEVVDPHARTRRGVRVGQPLAEARRLQPGLRCGTALAGSEFPSFRYCAGRVAPGIYMWVGQDPVASITLAHKPFIR
jgi:hypothetical protein